MWPVRAAICRRLIVPVSQFRQLSVTKPITQTPESSREPRLKADDTVIFWFEFYLRHVENHNDKPFVSSTFVKDVQNLRREFGLVSGMQKTNGRLCDTKLRTLFLQQQLYVYKNRVTLKVLNDRYRLLTESEKLETARIARTSYNSTYSIMSTKYQTPLPKFLDLNLVEADLPELEEKIELEKKCWDEFLEVIARQRQEHIRDLLANTGESLSLSRQVKLKQAEIRKKYKFHRHLEFRATPYILFLGSLKKKSPKVSNAELRAKFPPTTWTSQIDTMDVRFYELQSRAFQERYSSQNRQSALEAILNEDWICLKQSEVKEYAPDKLETFERAIEDYKYGLKNPLESRLGNTSENFGLPGINTPLLKGSLPPSFTQIRNLARDHKVQNLSSKKNSIPEQLLKDKRLKYNFTTNKIFTQSPIRLYANQVRREVGNLKYSEIKERFKKSTDEDLAKLTKQSEKLRESFLTQNQAAAKAAISANDWLALRQSEVKKFGSKRDMDDFLAETSKFKSTMDSVKDSESD